MSEEFREREDDRDVGLDDIPEGGSEAVPMPEGSSWLQCGCGEVLDSPFAGTCPKCGAGVVRLEGVVQEEGKDPQPMTSFISAGVLEDVETLEQLGAIAPGFELCLRTAGPPAILTSPDELIVDVNPPWLLA